MAADLEKLVRDFKSRVLQLVDRCRSRGIVMRPSNGLRDPFEQARLWRQSRSAEEIKAKIEELEAKGARFLADCIRKVGPQDGRRVTNTPLEFRGTSGVRLLIVFGSLTEEPSGLPRS